MANELLLVGAAIGALLLLGNRGSRQPAAVAAGGVLGTGPMMAGQGNAVDIGAILSGIFAASADEDIGIAPVPALSAQTPTPDGGPATAKIVVQDGNTPVIDQTPVFSAGPRSGQTFTVQGSTSEGFSLLGPTLGLMPTDQIRVAEFVGFGEGETFVTTPDTLANFLALFD